MSRTGITYEDVMEAAFDLHNQGEIPTIEKIRTYLGGTGSNTTISKYLQTWRKESAIDKDEISTTPTPDVVQAAVNSVWQQMREQADAEIEKIRDEAFQKIEAAQKVLAEVEETKNLINQQYNELQATYHAVSAEKEILTLDYKKLQEQFALLEEKHKGLDARYIDMQGMSNQKMILLQEAHQKEKALLEEKIAQQEKYHQELIDEIKSQHEVERHQQMLTIKNHEAVAQQLNKRLSELQTDSQEKAIRVAMLESALQSANNEKAKIESLLDNDNKRWQQFYNKTLVDDEIVKKLYDMPALETFVSTLNNNIHEVMDIKLDEFKKIVESAFKERETQDE